MKPKPPALSLLALLAPLLLAPGCALRDQAMGRVDLREIPAATALPSRAPDRVYVADFALDAGNFQGDQGARGALPGRLGTLAQGGAGRNLPQPLATRDPAAEARRIVAGLAEALTRKLTEKGLPAERVNAAGAPLPRSGWLVSGYFVEVDEGNRMQRAVIGVGQGATRMEVQVGLGDLAGPDPQRPFAVFGTVKEPGKAPGAIVTMNPYVAAARFVMEKSATPRDVDATAERIAAAIVKYRNQLGRGR